LNATTYWVFETVMIIAAAAWMLSAGYVTMKNRHIAITVILTAISGLMGGEIVALSPCRPVALSPCRPVALSPCRPVALSQMFRLGYDCKLSIHLICAACALATLIPPSISLIVYGPTAEVGISDLFMAGALLGIMLATFCAGYVLVRINLNHRCPALPQQKPRN
jgi:hypothetical protein